MLTEISMMVSGKMIKPMDLVNILILMVHNMKDIGSMINNMDKERNIGLMERSMRAIISMERKMGLEIFCGPIKALIVEIL